MVLALLFGQGFGQGEARADADASDRIVELDRRLAATADAHDAAMILVVRAEFYRLQGRWDASLRDLESAAAMAPEAEDLEFQQGSTLLAAGRAHEAVVALRAHASGHPEDGLAWHLLGRAYSELQLYAEAQQAFAEALRFSRRPAPGMFLEHADAIQARGHDHDEEALRSIESGIETLGPAISLELRAVELEECLGRVNAAVARIESISENAHSKAPWLLRKGEILIRAERADEARQTLLEARLLATRVPVARRHTRSNTNIVESIDDLLLTLRN